MSKKLIAVASAAALALSALVASPASAAVFSVDTNGGSGTGETSTAATTINVPSGDVIGWSTAGNTTATAVRYTVNTTGTTSSVSVTATGGIKLLTSTQYAATGTDAATSATGSATLTGSAVASAFTFYAATNSTTAGTIVITESGNVATRHLKGIAGPIYKITATAPSNVFSGVKAEIKVKAFDAFGNQITNAAFGVFGLSFLGGAQAVSSGATGTAYRTASTDQALNIEGAATGGSSAIVVTASGSTVAAADITAFGARDLTKFLSITTSTLEDRVTALTAQVAALTADYNALAAKYNKLVKKSKRVALK